MWSFGAHFRARIQRGWFSAEHTPNTKYTDVGVFPRSVPFCELENTQRGCFGLILFHIHQARKTPKTGVFRAWCPFKLLVQRGGVNLVCVSFISTQRRGFKFQHPPCSCFCYPERRRGCLPTLFTFLSFSSKEEGVYS
jgi:hypothetical protein